MPAPADLCDAVRRHCAGVAAAARWIRIDADAPIDGGGVAGLDPALHFLDAPREEVARYVLVLDAINFGSGWFPALRTDTNAITRRLTAHARGRGGTWAAAELRALDVEEVGGALDLEPAHELTVLYARALHHLGEWLGGRTALETVDAAGGSAERFAVMLAEGMPFFDDAGFWKRAQIAANDLVLAGAAAFADVDRLTVFADNLVAHVLRVDGVLAYAPELADRVDAGRPLAAGSAMETEIRACAVHACELLAARIDVAPRVLDNWLWNRGQGGRYAERRPHVTRTVFY